MNPLSRAINMILRGETDKFKNIIEEVLQDRASTILEAIYKEKSQNILEELSILEYKNELIQESQIVSINIPQSFVTRNGVPITLTDEQIKGISKLYENLNSNSKERLLKLLTESEEAVNRILNLSKIERKSNVK